MAKRLENMKWVPRRNEYRSLSGQGTLPKPRTDEEAEAYLKSIGYPHFIGNPFVIIPSKRQLNYRVYCCCP